MPKYQRSIPYFATFIALVSVIILCALGMWQIERGIEKAQRLTQIAQRAESEPFDIESILRMEDPRDLPMKTNGRLHAEHVFLLDNRIHDGQVGYYVIAPILTDAGWLLVNFGWLKGSGYRDQLPTVTLPTVLSSYSGVTSVPTINPMVTETITDLTQWPLLVQSIDLSLMASAMQSPLLPFVLQLSPTHEHGFVREWQPVVMAPEKHYAYAVQWFGLAIACLIIYLVAVIKGKRNV